MTRFDNPLDYYHKELKSHLDAIEFWTKQREFAEKELLRNMQRADDVRAKIKREENL